jgi:ABC-2 type transport system permease protein
MSPPATWWRSTLALLANELRLLGRRPENLLVAVVVPAAVLVFFGALGTGGARLALFRLDHLVPASVAVAIIATGFVNVGIASAYERSYGVLKRLGGAPIHRTVVVMAKIGAVLVVTSGTVLGLVAIAWLGLGWRGSGPPAPLILVAAVGLGTAAFTALGLALAGLLRAEAVLAIANGAFVGLLLVGGTIVPASELPGILADLARALPSSALVDALRAALGDASMDAGWALIVLAGWAVGAGAVAARTFRWD